jgi:hypothetical protein
MLKTFNALATTNEHTRWVAAQFPRNDYAFAQRVSGSVRLTTCYNDDADICMHFTVGTAEIGIYCNANSKTISGDVEGIPLQNATKFMLVHFGLDITAQPAISAQMQSRALHFSA